MEVYILKSAACLAILFLFYKLVLEDTALHTAKRLYLLTSLIVSFLIPFITFTETVVIEPVATTFSESFVIPTTEALVSTPEPINYIPYILWSLYGMGVLFFGFRFIKNLFSLVQKIRKNPVFKEKSFLYVLLKLPVTPHSFFNYIFFDKEAYEAGEIPKEVLIHEQAHVTQKHSWDILFFEIFQIVFWFNPLLYFFKRSIKLNHEFLADRTVLQTGAELATYQNILLDFSSKSSVPAMAHSINYSSIKKRFNVMKTNTSRKAAWLKGLLVLPLLSVLVYGFSETKQEFISSANTLKETSLEINKQEILQLTLSDNKITFKQNTITLEEFKNNIDASRYSKANLTLSDPIEKEFVGDVMLFLSEIDLLNQMTVCQSTTDEGKSINSGNIMSDIFKTKRGQNEETGVNGNNIKTFLLQIELSELRLNGIPVKLNNFAKAVDKYTKDWEETDYTSIKPQVFVAATPKAFLDKVDAEFRKTHFSKANGGMDIVPPPPPPPPLPPKVKMGEESLIPPPPPPTPKVVKKGEKSNIPPPPPPASPLDHVIKMAKENAAFLYNGKKITSDRAIALVKANSELNIHTENFKNSNPIVKITEAPIQLKD